MNKKFQRQNWIYNAESIEKKNPPGFKGKCVRYLALGFMIILGMYVVISMVGSGNDYNRNGEYGIGSCHLLLGDQSCRIPAWIMRR